MTGITNDLVFFWHSAGVCGRDLIPISFTSSWFPMFNHYNRVDANLEVLFSFRLAIVGLNVRTLARRLSSLCITISQAPT